MKYFQKVVSSVRAAFARRWKAFLRDLPGRMLLGRFGMWLVKAGCFLQVRYANWNREFRLLPEFPPHDLNLCYFHVSERLIDQHSVTFYGSMNQIEKQTPLVKSLIRKNGVAAVVLHPYEVKITKAKVYDWAELLPDIERILLEHLTSKPTFAVDAT